MAIEAKDEPFWRGGEAKALGACAPSGDAWTACIFSYYPPAIDMACTNDGRRGRWRVCQKSLLRKGDPPSSPGTAAGEGGAQGPLSRSQRSNWSIRALYLTVMGGSRCSRWSEPRQGAF